MTLSTNWYRFDPGLELLPDGYSPWVPIYTWDPIRETSTTHVVASNPLRCYSVPRSRSRRAWPYVPPRPWSRMTIALGALASTRSSPSSPSVKEPMRFVLILENIFSTLSCLVLDWFDSETLLCLVDYSVCWFYFSSLFGYFTRKIQVKKIHSYNLCFDLLFGWILIAFVN